MRVTLGAGNTTGRPAWVVSTTRSSSDEDESRTENTARIGAILRSGVSAWGPAGPRLDELGGLVPVEPWIAQRGVVALELLLVLHRPADALRHLVVGGDLDVQ